ncbi:MAG: CPBP family intramembrane metalloprotease [Vicinamibacteria bacterium]|nr:CPBP family intramembrane metalloprotease [Vicinamibacteria bacterium]
MTEAAALGRVLELRLRAARSQVAGLVVRKTPATADLGTERAGRGGVTPVGSAAGVVFGLLALGLALIFSRALFDAASHYAVASGGVSPVATAQAPRSRAHAEALAVFLLWAQAWLVCMGLGYRDPFRLGARVEALMPLPVSLRCVFVAEILERALINPLLWLTVFPLTAVSAWSWGHGHWVAVCAGAALTLVHGLTVGCVEFVLAIALRARVAPAHAGKVRALALGLGALSPMLVQLVMLNLLQARLAGRPGGTTAYVLGALGSAALISPAGVGLRVLQLGRPGLADSALALLTTVVVWALALGLLQRLSRHGLDLLVARSDRGAPRHRKRGLLARLPAGIGDELRALGRDLPALTLGVVVPILVLVINVFFLPLDPGDAGSAVVPLFVAGFFVAAACSTLPRFGRSIWLLATLPRPLDAMVIERAAVYGGLGLAAGLVALGMVWSRAGLGTVEVQAALVSLAVGVPALTIACGALSILGARPFATDPRQRLDAEAGVNQFVLVSALAVTAVLPTRERVLLLTFLAVTAAGLWQRARLHVPRLLDPAAGGPRPIDIADGMKGAIAFLSLQPLLAIGLREMPWTARPGATPWVVLIAFGLAGAMAIGLTVDPLVKQGLRLHDVIPLWRGPDTLPALVAGALAGCGTFGLGLGYVALLQHQLGFALPPEWAPRALAEALSHPLMRYGLGCVAAPVVEEILFRGLLFVGIRQALGERPAILLSAAVFAAIHSEFSFGGVFALGAGCAWVYQRTGLLSAAIAVHATHNFLAVSGMVG